MTTERRARARVGGFRTWLSALCLLATLAGCSQDDPQDVIGGDGDGDTGSEMPDSGDGDAGDAGTGDGAPAQLGTLHYPMVEGATWVYAHTGGNTDWEEEVSMTEITHEGKTAILMVDTPGPSLTFSESVLVRDGDVVQRVYKEILLGQRISQSKVTYDPGFARFDEDWVEHEVGYTTTLEYDRTELDGMDVLVSAEPRSHSYEVLAMDVDVEVPAGSFSGCIELRRLRLRDTMDTTADGDDKEFTFCPGVGKVREVELATMKLEELISCDIPEGACP